MSFFYTCLLRYYFDTTKGIEESLGKYSLSEGTLRKLADFIMKRKRKKRKGKNNENLTH